VKKSKKRSASSAQPETVFFVDRDLGLQFADTLRQRGLRVELLDDHFRPDTPDAEWLVSVSRRRWVVLTHDAKIRYNSRVKEAVVEAQARVIVVRGKVSPVEMAEGFLATLTHVLRFVRRHAPPYIAKQHRNARDPHKAGRIELWFGGRIKE
jgi:hypothetical protein